MLIFLCRSLLLMSISFVSGIKPPVIDLSALSYDFYSVPHSLFEAIEDAFINHGIFIGINYPFESTIGALNAFHSAQRLFNLPLETKKSLEFNETHHFGRGYLPFGSESGLSTIFEPKEGYSYGHPGHSAEFFTNEQPWLKAPNIWPVNWSTTEIQPLHALYNQFSNLSELLLMYILHCRRQQGKVTNLMIAGGSEISLMRLFHYYPVTSLPSPTSNIKEKDMILGSSPHTDWGLLTIILQNEISGCLQYRKDNQWIDVPYHPSGLIFNLGDYFHLVTHGEYHAPVHRVVMPEKEYRTSFVFFFYPHYDSPLTKLSQSKAFSMHDNNGKNNHDSAAIEATVKGIEHEIAVDGIAAETISLGKENHQPSQSLQYNTLTVLNYEKLSVLDMNKEQTMKFGDYILKKWRDVYRK
jgi:isopenicillin N synthase-like dioxygenase